jgi:hypothetical protein
MKIDIKILEELARYNKINKYILEQEVPPPPADPAAAVPPPPADPAAAAPPAPDAAALPPAPGAPPAAGAEGAPPTPVDVETDAEVEKIGDEKGKKKEIEVTDLVKSQKSVEKKQEEYFDNLFSHLEDLESKLSVMDEIVTKLNDLEVKIEKYRTKTPEEKLELRSLDSGPYNQKLSDFFVDKQEDMEKSGKNEYILTKDEVEGYSPNEIKKSFRNFGDEDDMQMNNFQKIQ